MSVTTAAVANSVPKNIDRNHSGAGTGTEIQLLSNADNSCATLVMIGEDHTLGNSFRYVLAKNRDCDFVGYSIPHPSEMKLNMRVQTKTRSVTDVLIDSADTLSNICEHVRVTFDAAEKQYRAKVAQQAGGADAVKAKKSSTKKSTPMTDVAPPAAALVAAAPASKSTKKASKKKAASKDDAMEE